MSDVFSVQDKEFAATIRASPPHRGAAVRLPLPAQGGERALPEVLAPGDRSIERKGQNKMKWFLAFDQWQDRIVARLSTKQAVILLIIGLVVMGVLAGCIAYALSNDWQTALFWGIGFMAVLVVWRGVILIWKIARHGD